MTDRKSINAVDNRASKNPTSNPIKLTDSFLLPKKSDDKASSSALEFPAGDGLEMMINAQQVYTPDGLANTLLCGAETIRRHIRKGKLLAADISLKNSKRKTYRIIGSDALKWFKEQYT